MAGTVKGMLHVGRYSILGHFQITSEDKTIPVKISHAFVDYSHFLMTCFNSSPHQQEFCCPFPYETHTDSYKVFNPFINL